MKKNILFLLAILWGVARLNAGESFRAPRFDQRIDLLSVVYRLAGANEYTHNRIREYAQAADAHFSDFHDHAAVLMAREMRKTHSVSFDAVITFALSLEIEQGVRLNEQVLHDNMDPRWTLDNAREFARLLDDFYAQTRFHEFFAARQELQQQAIDSFMKQAGQLNLEWIEGFYGEAPKGYFQVILGMLHQGGYGPGIKYPDGTTGLYAVISTNFLDELGIPYFTEMDFNTVIHEFNHPFANPRMQAIYPQLADAARLAFECNNELMTAQHYGQPTIMMNELLVRAAEVRYLMALGADSTTIAQRLDAEKKRGFFWISQMVDLLGHYESNRAQFPTLSAYMPRLAAWHNSPEFQQVVANYRHEKQTLWPGVISTSIAHGSQLVDPATTTLVIAFDRPMNTGHVGIFPGSLGREAVPRFNGHHWNESKTRLTLNIILEPHKSYSLSLPMNRFRDESATYMLRQSVNIDFQTGE